VAALLASASAHDTRSGAPPRDRRRPRALAGSLAAMINFIPKACPSVALLYGKRPLQRIAVGAKKLQIEIPLDVVSDIPSKVDTSMAYVGNKWGTFGPMLNEKLSVVDAAAQQLEDVVKVKSSELSEKHRASYEVARIRNRQFSKWSMDFEAGLAHTCSRVQRGCQSARSKAPVESMRQRFKSARGQVAGLGKSLRSASFTTRNNSDSCELALSHNQP